MIKKCIKCGEEKEHHGKGLCYYCYKKHYWKPPKIICKRCDREMFHQAKGLCPGCYNFVFHVGKNKAWNYKKYHNIDFELYKKITEKCVLCDFNKIVSLHHLDENKKNNSTTNLVGLCPNHHMMLHDFRYKKNINNQLREIGFLVPKNKKLDFSL